jgi:hypothetical protein
MHGRSLFHVGKEIVVVAAFVVKECYGLAAKLHCRSLECEHAEARNKVSISICIRPMTMNLESECMKARLSATAVHHRVPAEARLC